MLRLLTSEAQSTRRMLNWTRFTGKASRVCILNADYISEADQQLQKLLSVLYFFAIDRKSYALLSKQPLLISHDAAESSAVHKTVLLASRHDWSITVQRSVLCIIRSLLCFLVTDAMHGKQSPVPYNKPVHAVGCRIRRAVSFKQPCGK